MKYAKAADRARRSLLLLLRQGASGRAETGCGRQGDYPCMTSTACILSKEEIQANLACGQAVCHPSSTCPTEGTTTFHDVIYGDITVNNEELDDMILIKSDGYPYL